MSKAAPTPTPQDPIARIFVDKEMGGEGFSDERVGKTGTVHLEQVLEYNQEPDYRRDLLFNKLTL